MHFILVMFFLAIFNFLAIDTLERKKVKSIFYLKI